jgi:signal transduction histidine kinase/CheY-like chemotaxis protein
MNRLLSLAALLSATAQERRKQIPVRVLLIILVCWAIDRMGRPEWIPAWALAAVGVQIFEIVAMRRVGESARKPGVGDVIVALASTMAMAALFAATAVTIWSFDGKGLQGFAMLIIAGGLLTNVASGIEARSIFFVGATPYLVALVAMPIMAIAGSPSGDPILTTLGSALFIGAMINVYWRVHAARIAELRALDQAGHRLQQAETAMADRAAMAAIISHELRTPVSAILAGAHIVRDESAPLVRQETADLIIDASALMTRMLNDLLDHSKMEAGAMSLESRDFELSTVISQTQQFWRAQAAEKGLVLRSDDVAPGQWLKGDPYRLRQILNNLLSNAIKFTASGEISIQVALAERGPQKRELTITVRDEGPGIPVEAMDRLFTPFAQGSSEVARNYGGTGLGLKVSRDLARAMGGDLTVANNSGVGATFTLSVPLPVGAPVETQSEAETAPLELQPRLRILAVDDHEINRRTLALVLQPLGALLATASDGTLALDLLERQPFDVVLMDVNMPGIDGNETTRRLRASGGCNAQTPVIGFSAGTEAEQIEACLKAGMTDWLAKPLEPRALYEALRRATAAAT